jgi:thymidylate synthase (FAD)
MPTPVDIGIFMIGRTVVDKDEVRRWLDFIGANEFEIPDDGAVTNPALLIALAGKRCYKSFQKSLNPNITRIRENYRDYFDNILSSGHGSVLEHSVYNLAIENVSRVFTGEMNRHRAGWAISEGSMRFIRYSESIPYWVPDSIKGEEVFGVNNTEMYVTNFMNAASLHTPHELAEMVHGQLANNKVSSRKQLEAKKELTRQIFHDHFRDTETAYKVMEAIWAEELAPESKFHGKKEITSMMRRIVGMGVATGGVWSGNIRGLRHVITMRASKHAEEEMLHVYGRVAKMIGEKEPDLFGDFVQTDGGFWVPKYLKV